jgi:DNA polymerase
MDNNTDRLPEMLRRALKAQVDLGMGEFVVEDPRPAAPAEVAARMAEVGRVVSVGSALGMRDEEQAQQEGLALTQPTSYESLEDHYKAICNCLECPLGQTRNKFVYGVGSPHADIMFVGEAPGADEDRLGEPFVGRAGQLLDKILAAIGFTRDDVYIANILKCRPPGNRDPQPDEMSKCFPYLREQVSLIRPRLICALGRVAAQAMLQTTTPLGRMRGKWHEYAGVPMMVTYHPAALLRFQSYKKDTWADMKMLKARYDRL